MKIHKITIYALALLSFASCNNDDIVSDVPGTPDTPDTPDTPTEGYQFTFDGGVDIQNATRASWNDDSGSGSLIFQWDYTPEATDGNELAMVFLDDELLASTAGKYHTYVNVNKHSQYTDDAHWARFKTVEKYPYDMPSGEYDGHKVIAVTPLCVANGSGVSSTADDFTATMPMPATFTQAADQKPEFLRNYMYMYAESTIAGGSATLAFKHIPATFRFVITNKRPAEATINSVQVSLVDADGSTLSVASQNATLTAGKVNRTPQFTYSQDTHTKVTTLLGENGTAVEKSNKYTAYALVLPLADNNAFKNNALRFTIKAQSPDNEYLSFELDGSLIEGANRTIAGEGCYNWVGGKSYTIRMSLSDVLTFDDMTVNDWIDGGTVDDGECIEAWSMK